MRPVEAGKIDAADFGSASTLKDEAPTTETKAAEDIPEPGRMHSPSVRRHSAAHLRRASEIVSCYVGTSFATDGNSHWAHRRSRQTEAKMFKSQRAFKESERETRSAEEAMNFLNENFGPDECDRLAFMATMISITIYERQPNEELFWSAAFARHERRALNDETRRELQALLDESRHWAP